MNQDDSKKKTDFGIASVAQLTGISQHVLRMWERRYHAVQAKRAENGRRRYSRDDVQRLLLIKRLIDAGEPVGEVASLSSDELTQRSKDLRVQVQDSLREGATRPVRTAVLGSFLLNWIETADSLPSCISLVSRTASLSRFRADIARQKPEALVIEQPVLGTDSIKVLLDLKNACGARLMTVVFGFGRAQDIERLRAEGINAIRRPTSLVDVFNTLTEPFPTAPEAVPERKPPDTVTQEGELDLSNIPTRRFSESELARLANASSTVDCECPTHLVDLVMSLSAFEDYSADCENRGAKDAALHAYLHAITAQVREQMEAALARVAEAEGLLPGGSIPD